LALALACSHWHASMSIESESACAKQSTPKDPNRSNEGGADADEAAKHVEDFTQRTGMSPLGCYWLVLLCLALRIIGWSWVAMVVLEYTRYYVVNDVTFMTSIDTVIKSPVALLNAFVFPCWGRFADQASRKPVLVSASVVNALCVWLLTMLPSIETYVVMRIMGMMAGIHSPVNDAMLRDLFTASEWERKGGGVTGIKAKMAILGTISTGFAVAIGMAILFAGDKGIGLANEYTLRKSLCRAQKHCVPRGQVSWEPGGWYVDGSLRLLMLMGSIVISIEALVVIMFLPETLPKARKNRTTFRRFFIKSWREHTTPWNNLRIFATDQLRALCIIRLLMFIVGSGGSTFFITWYRRTEMDTFTMYTVGVTSGAVGFLILFFIKFIVERFGDLRGIWLSSIILAILFAIGIALVPPSVWQLYYIVMPLFGGPSGALSGFTPALLSKLIPPDIQATFHTGKSFMWFIQEALFVWPWLGLLAVSEKMPFPFDALSIWVGVAIGSLVLVLTVRELHRDPAKHIKEGKALESFWKTDYALGPWYKRHRGEPIDLCHVPGISRVGLFLDTSDDCALPAFLQFMRQQPWRSKKLSVIFYFGDEAQPASSKPLQNPRGKGWSL